jgi:hypothetical protein
MQARRICAVRSASVSVVVMLTTMGAVENGLTIGNKAPTVLTR